MRVASALVDRSGAVLRRHLLAVVRALESGQVLLAALASVVRYPGSRLEPLLQGLAALSLLKRLHHSMVMWNERQEQMRLEALECDGSDPAEDRVRCEVLHEPDGGQDHARVDVIFIHGLNGSIRKTWTQGERSVEDGVQRQLLKTYSSGGEEDAEAEAAGARARRRRAAPPAIDLTISNHHFTVSCKRRGEAPRGAPQGRDLLVCDCDDCTGSSSSGCSTPDPGPQRQQQPPRQHPRQQRPKSKCWPRDWLPVDCPGVRVLAIDYTTDPYLWRPVWVPKLSRRTMQSRSQEMTKKLLELGVGRRPIVWAAHSKGGLFVKQILVDASESCSELVKNTQGILFYSVPHHGSKLARINIPWLLGQSVEITEVKKGKHMT
ncbi:Protein SERAC1 [Frankliniella fusca]|uniref:Protein SERAC1 n=1 Tax=Frankliniella fusca TaxID=407009 RepID=A0AAE1HDK8_9NEOP|nr:Protein SERAC1 [Frankliniella fusca]